MNKQKKESFIKNILKKIKLRTLILLIILLSFNSYAWFIYATKVSGGLSAYVSGWNVTFRAGEEEITTQVVFEVEQIYPGMDAAEKTLTAYNSGDVLAELSYEINSITVLETTYKTSDELTSEDLIAKLNNELPFTINISIDNTHLYEENGSATLKITLEWPFESAENIEKQDELDTQWGERVYEFNKNNPNEPSIHIEMLVKATQKERENVEDTPIEGNTTENAI